jgi:hypothetical protein
MSNSGEESIDKPSAAFFTIAAVFEYLLKRSKNTLGSSGKCVLINKNIA